MHRATLWWILARTGRQAAYRIDGAATFNQGDTYTITGDNGQTVQVQVTADGNGIIDNGDGTVNVTDGTNIFPIAKETIRQQVEQANLARVAEFEAQRAAENAEEQQAQPSHNVGDTFALQDADGNTIHGEIQAITEDGVEIRTDEPLNGKRVQVIPAKDFEDMIGSSSDVSEAAATPTQENGEKSLDTQPVSALERIPKSEEGEPIYEQTDSDTAWDAIVEQTEGDEAMAQTVADGIVADKEAALKKIEKTQPKGGNTPAEKIASLKAHKAAIDAAKENLAIWRKIAGTAERRRMDAEAERKRIADEEAARRKEEDGSETKKAAEKGSDGLRNVGNGRQDGTDKTNTDKVTPIGESDFGFVYDQFKGNAQGAIRQLMKMQDGEALGALHHDEIGDIDLVWGKAGTRKSDGYGLAKLVKFHPEVLDNLQGILDGMHITKRSENRVQLENDEYQAAVRLTWNGEEKLWLLTTFKKKETSEPTNSRTDVDSNLDGKSDDTATRQSSDVSAGKVPNNQPAKQEKGGKSSAQESNAETEAELRELERQEAEWAAEERAETARKNLVYGETIGKLKPIAKEWMAALQADNQANAKIFAKKAKAIIAALGDEELGLLVKGLSGLSYDDKVAHSINMSILSTAKAEMKRRATAQGNENVSEDAKTERGAMEASTEKAYERKMWSSSSDVDEMKAREAYLRKAMGYYETDYGTYYGTEESAEVFPESKQYKAERKALVEKMETETMSDEEAEAARGALREKYRDYLDRHNEVVDELGDLRRAIMYAEGKQQREREAEEKKRRKEDPNGKYSGFLKGKSGLLASSADKALSRRVDFREEGSMTVAEYVEKHHAAGDLTFEKKLFQQPLPRRWNAMSGYEQRKWEETHKPKEDYVVNSSCLGKTAYEYAEYLSKTKSEPLQQKESEEKTDNQGNPLNEDGTLKIEKIASVDELTDEDFMHPTRSVELPTLPENIDTAIGAEGKPVVIKKNIFEKNWETHKFPFNESRAILKAALYDTDLVGQTQPNKKPLHWVAIKIDEKSPIVVLEVNDYKDRVEIVGWYTLDERNLERIKRQAEKNGGELVILSPKSKVESLSTPLEGLSSEGKVLNNQSAKQEKGGKSSENDKGAEAAATDVSSDEQLRQSKTFIERLRKAGNKLPPTDLYSEALSYYARLKGVQIREARSVIGNKTGNEIADLLDGRDDAIERSYKRNNPREHKAEGAAPVSHNEEVLRDAVDELLRGSGIEVVSDVEEGQRVLDMANGGDVRLNAKHISKRKQWINDYVNAAHFISGRDKKEIRKGIEQMVANARSEAKELYERVLAGDFDDVTLRRINDYIDNATPNNGFYRPLSKRLPTGALLSLSKGERTGSVDALFSRICESTVGKNGRVSAEGRRRIEEKKEELLEKWAKATGNWHESIADFTDNTTPIKSGTDSDVYLSSDGKTVIKASKGKFENKKFPSDIDQVALFNSLFPDSSYRILGYGRINGKFVKFLEQNLVDFSTSTPLTTEERVEHMRKFGFKPRNEEKTVFSNGNIVVSDLQKSNIVHDAAGNVRVIDADVKLHTKDIGGSWTYPDVEEDTGVADRVRFFRTPNGDAYGFTVGGKIYYDPRIATSETLVHEYAHLWATALRAGNAEEWRNVVDLMKGTSIWDEIKKKYPELKTDDEIADEVIAQYSGRRGAERLREETKRITEGGGGVFEKAEAISALEKVKRALAKFWKGVCDMLHIHYTSAEEVADRVMKDLLDGVDPRKFGKENGLRMQENEEIADIVAKAKADGTYMKAPNGKPSNLSRRQWAQVRTKAFKEWFGDWEKSARIEKLRGSEPVEITGEEITPSDDLKEYKKNALEYGKSLRGSYTNEDTGEVIDLTGGNKRGGIREILQHDYKDKEHLQSIAAIPQIIEKSVFIDELSNGDKEHYPDVKSFRYYVCGLKIGGTDYTVKAVVAEQNNGARYYDHRLTDIEKGKLLSIVPTIQKAGIDGNLPNSAYKDRRLISILQTNSSKVVDENGEPLVVYHGTAHPGFSVFNTQGRFGKRNSTSRGTGVYATDDRGLAYIYTSREDYENRNDYRFSGWDGAGQVYSLYLNMRNPLVVECDGADFDEIRISGRKTSTDAVVRRLRRGGFGRGYDGVVFRNVYDGDYTTDYVALSSGQIKSATDNVGTFDAENNDIRYQFVGERGAEAADRAEEVTTRLDNLNVAREMEEAKKDAKAIKMATGWERGADGKWRYEIPDIEYVPTGDADLNRRVRMQPWSKELEELSDRIFDGETLTDAENERFEELAAKSDEIRKLYKEQDKKYLADYVRADELFKAYPKLRAVNVEFVNKGASAGGSYSEKENTIYVNYNSLVSTEEVLAHEIQHAIQCIEGFAKGGSVEAFDAAKRTIANVRKAVDEGLDKAAGLCGVPTVNEWLSSLDDETLRSLMAERLEYARQHKNFPLSYVYLDHAGYSTANRELLVAKLDKANELIAKQKKIFGGNLSGDSYALYKNLAGEVESRNVQKRMRMTDEERRASLAAETEDVAREDQIFLFGEGGESHMESRTLSDAERKDELRTANERFNNDLIRYQHGEMDKNEMLRLGKPQGVMRAFLPDMPIVMRQRILNKGSVRKHNVAIEALADMPNHLSHPIFVFKRSDNALGVLTEMQDRDGKNVCVAIELNRQIRNGGEILEVNDIRSVHGRNVADIVYPIVQNGTLKWVDKEKGLAYLSSASRYVQQEIDKQDLDTVTKVVENFENPEVSDENVADEELLFRTWFGGNSGYVGYSMSKRAAEAREAGRFPKGDFRKEYGVSQKSLDALVDAGIVDNSEWHHTSMYGNKTPFYGWTEDTFADIYKEHKAEIDKMVRQAAAKEETTNPYRSLREMDESGDSLSKEYLDAESAEHLRYADEIAPIYKKYRDEFDRVAPEKEEAFRKAGVTEENISRYLHIYSWIRDIQEMLDQGEL